MEVPIIQIVHPMHILEIPSFFTPHGGEFCLEQAKALCSLGHEVRILACTQLAITVDGLFYLNAPRGCWVEENEGIECYCSYVHGLPKMVQANQQRWVGRVLQMYDEYRRNYGRPDVIHAHCAKWAGVAAQQIAQREGMPYFITEHLSSILYRKDFGGLWEQNVWAKPMIQKTMEDARCVITVSDEQVEDLAPFFGRNYRHQVVSNIVDVDFYSKKPEPGNVVEAHSVDHPFRWVCLARADVYGKGYDILAEAVKDDWLKKHGAELHIAGHGTKRLKKLFPQKEVVIHGNLDKDGVRSLLWQSDALVLPTRSESQGLVLLEAMSSGIPVLTTEAVPQNVRVSGACTVVPIGKSIPLANEMARMIESKPEADWMDEVRELAAPMSVAKQLEKIFAQR